MQVTVDQLSKIYTSASKATLTAGIVGCNEAMAKYGIDTKNEVASFLAQIGVESNELSARLENLNYSAQGLLNTFPKYFNATTAAKYARQPAMIANHVYANRMGNGNEASGDGWKFRGHGWIQITGRNNTSAYAKYKEMSINDALDFLSTVEGAWDSAGWFWKINGIDKLDDDTDARAETLKINGGTNGLAQRQAYLDRGVKVLG